jgi:hypothetical protein
MRTSIRYDDDGTSHYMVNGREVAKSEFDRLVPTKTPNYAAGECPGMHPDYHDWSNENGGRGRYCPQKAQRARDPNGYAKSRDDLIDWAVRQGKSVEKD